MLYPEKISAKKSNQIIQILLLESVLLAFALLIINKLTTPNIPWAALANAGIVYFWITVLYAVSKNTNIAAYVLIQTIAVSALTYYIDYRLGFRGWSIAISIPIIIIVANVTMFVLTLVSRRRFIKYAVYQLLIIIVSLMPVGFIVRYGMEDSILTIISCGVSVVNFMVSLCLCAKDFLEVVVRKFHV